MTLRSELEKALGVLDIENLRAVDRQALEYAFSVCRAFLGDHGPALLEAVDCQEAITEQAMVTECITVTGRDPTDVIRGIIGWHIQVDKARGDA